VHVLNWSGELLFVLRLDAYVIGLTVDPDESTLYARKHDLLPGVAVFQIPAELRDRR
jgi:hypothetical protein